MTTELVILFAAFLFMMGWFLDALRQEEHLMTSAYVHLVEENWKKLPQSVIETTRNVYARLFGPIWSLRSLTTITAFSVTYNFVILFILDNIITTMKLVDFNGESYAFDGGDLILFSIFIGTFHDILSFNLTRIILNFKCNFLIKFLSDFVIATILFVSTICFFIFSFMLSFTFLREGVDLFYDLLSFSSEAYVDAVLDAYSSFSRESHSFFSDEIDWLDQTNFLYAAITALFPTFCYLFLLGASIMMRFALLVSHETISSMLDWLSQLPTHRIGLIMSGLSGLILVLQALIAYRALDS